MATRLALKMRGHYGMAGNLASWVDYDDPRLRSARSNQALMAQVELTLGKQLDLAKTMLEAERDIVL